MAILEALGLILLGTIIGFGTCGLLTGNALEQAQEVLDEAQKLIERQGHDS